MPPRRQARPIPPDVDDLRAALEAGKLVRVGIAPSGQFPDGVTGRVRRIGDPAVDGDEFIFVEVPVGGAKDVLPFAAVDLIGSPARKRVAPGRDAAAIDGGSNPAARSKVAAWQKVAARQPAPAASGNGQRLSPPAAATTPVTAPSPTEAARPGSPGATSAGSTSPGATSAGSTSPAPRSPGSASPTPSSAGAHSPTPDSAAGNSPSSTDAARSSPALTRPSPVSAAAPRTSSAGAARGKRSAVSILISTTGDENASWRIEARIGAKVVIRPTSVPPTRVWEIVQSLDEPKLTNLVQNLLDDHRRSTQARADALAAQLSALQAELRTFPQD